MTSKRKISVLNILTTIDDGGLEMLVYRIYSGLDKNKYDLKIVSLTPLKDNFLEHEFEKLGSKIKPFSFRNKGKGIADTVHNFFQYVKFIFWLWGTRFDVIHSHDFFPALVARTGMILSLRKLFCPRIRIFTTYHNVYYWLKPLHHKINKMLSLVTRKIVCVSNTVKEVYVLQEKISPEKFEVIRNGVNDRQFYPDRNIREDMRTKLGYAKGDLVIGCVAVLTERKGQIYLLEAFLEIARKHPNARLLLVGGSREHETDYAGILTSFVEENNLGAHVKFHPPVKDVNPLYNAIDLFVLPSVTEGFGLSAFECILTEKICLFSDLDVFKELTLGGKYGFHFEGKNSKSLFEKLDYLVANFESLKLRAGEYRKFVIDNYSETVMVGKYDRMYTESLNLTAEYSSKPVEQKH